MLANKCFDQIGFVRSCAVVFVAVLTLSSTQVSAEISGRSCQRESISALGHGDIQQPPTFKPDFSCAVEAKDVLALSKSHEVILADLRLGIEFASYHIQDALQLSLAELRNKPYWRSKHVILIGSGKAEAEVYSVCAQLKQVGYKKVQVLHGGMLQWLRQDLPVTGNPPLSALSGRLSAVEFWQESRNPANLLLLDQKQSVLRKELSGAQIVVLSGSEGVQKIMEQYRSRKNKKSFIATVILAVDPTVPDEQLQKFQQDLIPIPVLTYKEPPEVFEQQLATQKSMWSVRTSGPKRPRCGS